MADGARLDPERARALAFAVLVLSAGGVVGWLLGGRIVGATTSVHLGALFSGMSVFALVAAFAKDGLLALIELGRYLRTGGDPGGQLWRPMASLFVVALLGAMSVVVLVELSLKQPPSCEQVQEQRDKDGTFPLSMNTFAKCMLDDLDQVGLVVEQLVSVMKELDNTVSRIKTRIAPCPLLFENAGLSQDRVALSGVGVSLEETHMERLRSTANYLAKNCSDTGLRLEVTGYHSDAPFRTVGRFRSNELNEQAAESRATTVAAALGELLEKRGVRADFEVRHRRMDDSKAPEFTDAGALSVDDQWLISRSVFIRVANPSSCSSRGRALCEGQPAEPSNVPKAPSPATGDTP